MPKPRKLILCLLVLPFVLLLNSTGAMGQERCIVPTVPGEVKDIESYLKLQCDPANPEEIARNSSATIGVIGGAPPYYWEVAGKGFSMTPVTMGPTNKLYADSTACGFADITVTEAHGEQVPCDVKCTSGQWSEYEIVAHIDKVDVCPDSTSCKVWMVSTRYDYCTGNPRYRYRLHIQYTNCNVCTGECPQCPPDYCGFCSGAIGGGKGGCFITIGCGPADPENNFLGAPAGGFCIVRLAESEWGCGE